MISLEKALVCVIVIRERHVKFLVEKRLTVFSDEFQLILAGIHATINENLSVLAASFSRDPFVLCLPDEVMTSKDRHLE